MPSLSKHESARFRAQRSAVLLLALFLAVGCARDDGGVPLSPPFNSETRIGMVRAAWKATGEERAFAEGVRLGERESMVQYRIDVESRLHGKAYVRLTNFRLLDEAGLTIGRDPAAVECTLATGRTLGVLGGTVWVPEASVERIARFGIDALAVPLGEPGRAIYREWLLQGRPGREQDVDAELARQAAAPPCPGERN